MVIVHTHLRKSKAMQFSWKLDTTINSQQQKHENVYIFFMDMYLYVLLQSLYTVQILTCPITVPLNTNTISLNYKIRYKNNKAQKSYPQNYLTLIHS